MLANQALYSLSHTSSPFALVILELGSCELFAPADLGVITGVSYWRQNSGLFLYMQGK
jgi:hypothetical protein